MDSIEPMGRLVRFLFFVLHYLIVVNFSSSLVIARHLCRGDQSLYLLQFKQALHIDETASMLCEDNGMPSYTKTMSWNQSTDCCRWDGVTCDKLTGRVIGLDLGCSQLQGDINSNSSLFQLSHLQKLNLAYNDFSSSLISSKFGGFASLTHLNLSTSGFLGDLPLEFSRLSNLISLDLSTTFGDIKIQPYIFKLLLQNFTQLIEVLLSGTDIASEVPNNLSASITILDLGGTNLRGELPDDVFHLPNLQTLWLGSNPNLTGHLPEVKWSSSGALRDLGLDGTSFSGEIPESIGHLKSLDSLDLDSCRFSGSIPESLGNLTQLNYLILFSNNFSGLVPPTLANLEQLRVLDLSSNSLGGQVPNYFSNFKKMKRLALRNNFFIGEFPSSVINLTQIGSLELGNNSLTGSIPSIVPGFQNIVFLDLGDNLLNGTIPSWVFSLPSLRLLYLQSNQLTGQVSDFQYQSLEEIDLSGNKLHGPVPKSFSTLINLTRLDIASNDFSGDLEVSMFSNMNQLRFLYLSNNNLSLTSHEVMNSSLPESLETLFLSSCGVKDLDLLRGANNLGRLDLSHNMLRGQVFSGLKWFKWGEQLFHLNLSHNFLTDIRQLPFQNLNFLDLHSNLLQGPLFIPPVTTLVFFTSDNNLTGEVPSSICQLSSLMVLDLSKNNLNGVVPQCLGNMSMGLSVLDLHMNRFHGKIPSTFPVGSNLRSLNLRNNRLEGIVPKSLSNCRELEVLDIGNNNLNGTFPWWLETLPKLQVLSLRSNNLQGTVRTSRTQLSFSAVRILDLSDNNFTGSLPTRVFRNLRGMMRKDETTRQLVYIGDSFYQDSVMVIIKGQELQLERILSTFTTIDLSSNKFQGQIPYVIGDLISLRGLNLSHNCLGGQIPQVLGNLRVLESLDLSSNQLEGEIPQKLTALSYLSLLNVSHNQLVGAYLEAGSLTHLKMVHT